MLIVYSQSCVIYILKSMSRSGRHWMDFFVWKMQDHYQYWLKWMHLVPIKKYEFDIFLSIYHNMIHPQINNGLNTFKSSNFLLQIQPLYRRSGYHDLLRRKQNCPTCIYSSPYLLPVCLNIFFDVAVLWFDHLNADGKVSGSGPSTTLMSLGKIWIYICHPWPRCRKGNLVGFLPFNVAHAHVLIKYVTGGWREIIGQKRWFTSHIVMVTT